MPKAPPNSLLVSAMPEARPACSGSTVPTMRSVAKVNAGASPSEKTQ